MLAGTVSPLRDISTHTRESSMDRMNKSERQATHLWFEDVPQQACPLQACTKGLLHKLAMFSGAPRHTPHNLDPWTKGKNSTPPTFALGLHARKGMPATETKTRDFIPNSSYVSTRAHLNTNTFQRFPGTHCSHDLVSNIMPLHSA